MGVCICCRLKLALTGVGTVYADEITGAFRHPSYAAWHKPVWLDGENFDPCEPGGGT